MTHFRVQRGDRVAYIAQFLQAAGAYVGDWGAARGTVVEVHQHGDRQLVTVDWGTPYLPRKVWSANLAIVGANSRFCAC